MDISENSEPLPGYRLIRFLGQGSFGQAWEAIAPGDIPIAIKFIRLDQALSESEQRELTILRTVRHAHLLDVHLVHEIGGYLMMGMPLCDQDLLGRLKVCQSKGLSGIPPAELLDIMEESAKALDFLHQNHVIHRDIKPANIFLVGGSAKVADFGLAKVFDNSLLGTQSGIKGTPAYLAPEMVRGKAAKATDQYSLAVSYCQLRNGRLPIQADNIHALILAHVEQPPNLSWFTPQEASVLRRALAKNPEDRWPTCRAFVKALQQVVDTSSVATPQSPSPVAPLPEPAATITLPTTILPRPKPPGAAKQTKRRYKAGDERNDNGLKMVFVACPAGSVQRNDSELEDYERIRIDHGFWLGKYPVTQKEWLTLMGSRPWKGKDCVLEHPECPVTYISWEDAMLFCRKFTITEQLAGRLNLNGMEYTLPTEDQWEFACRAGTSSRYFFGNEHSLLARYAWHKENAYDRDEKYPHQVGQKEGNPWNLFDMHGNVCEWCGDSATSVSYNKLRSDPLLSRGDRVYRGGSWSSSAFSCDSASRSGDAPTKCDPGIGFRVAFVKSKK